MAGPELTPPLHELYVALRQQGGFIDLSARAKWRLTGEDRVRYLNGQLSADVRRAGSAQALPACVTTAKGRLSGFVYLSAGWDFLRLDAEPELRESLAARLERYIIADDVAIQDVTEDEVFFHLLAPADCPDIPGAEIRKATRLGGEGTDIIAPAADHVRVLTALREVCEEIPEPLVEAMRIEAGIPRWGAELTEETLPPEAGLDRTAIDYQKGCYIGQEVISRIKSVGHVNRRLMGFVSHAPLTAGMTLLSGAETVGAITSGTWSFGLETWAGLGYLKRGFDQSAMQACPPGGTPVPVHARELPLVVLS